MRPSLGALQIQVKTKSPRHAPRPGARQKFPSLNTLTPATLNVSKQRAAVIKKMVTLLQTQYSESSILNLLSEMQSWTVQRGKNKGSPLEPSTKLTLATALLTGVAFITGKSPSSPRISRALRSITEAVKGHIRRQAVPASKAEVERAIQHPSTSATTGLAIALTWSLGCRVADVQRLQFKDMTLFSVQRKNDVVRVRCRAFKGQKPGLLGYWRYIPLTPFTKSVIRFIVEGTNHPSEYLFPSSVYNRVVRALKSANPSLSGHSLRRGVATLLAFNGWSEKRIQAFLGHQSLETTRQYIQPHPIQANVRRQIEMVSSAL